MTRGSFKAGVWMIVAAHWRTYVDARGGKGRPQDWAAFGLPPIVVFALCIWRHVELTAAASAGLLTVSGLLSAFLFGVITQISGRAMDLGDDAPEPGSFTSTQTTNLLELAANAGYASLACIAAAAVFVVASVTTHWWLRISSALGLAVFLHMLMVLLMVMRREFALTQALLERVRTGAGRSERSSIRKQAS